MLHYFCAIGGLGAAGFLSGFISARLPGCAARLQAGKSTWAFPAPWHSHSRGCRHGEPGTGGLLVQRLCREGSPASAGPAPSITALPAARQRSEEVTLPNKQGGGWCAPGQERRASRGTSPVIYGLWELFADSAARWPSHRRGGCKDKHPPERRCGDTSGSRAAHALPGSPARDTLRMLLGLLPDSQGCSGEGAGWLKAGTESKCAE